LDAAAERGGREGDRRAGEQSRALTLEHRMRANVEEDVEIARRGAARPGFALGSQADAGAVVDAGRDRHIEPLHTVDPPFAAAIPARAFEHLATPVAVGARALDHEQALMGADLAAPGAQVAAAGAGAFRRARAVTWL